MRPFRRSPVFLPALIAALLVLSACAADDRYTYETIRAEYPPPAASPTTAASTANQTSSSRATGGPLSLAEAIRTALAQNPDNQAAAARILQAEAALDAAESAFYPTLRFYTEYARADAPSAYLFKTIDQRKLPPDTNFNDPDSLTNYESGLAVQWNLFNGGRDILRRQMAQTGRSAARLDRKTVENALVASVIRAYYDALAARGFIQIAEESVQTVDKQLEIMRARLEGGGALKSDVLSLEVRKAESEEERVRRRNGYRLALNALANVMGVPPEPPPALAENGRLEMAMPDAAAGLDYALANRPDLRRIRERVRQSRMGVDAARAGYLPTVDLHAQYYLDDEDAAYDLDRDNWQVALVLNWNLFTGFRTRSAVREASARLSETLAMDRKTGLGLRTDVKNAYLRLSEAEARLQVTRRGVAAAEESLELVRRQFTGGAVPITRFLEAELDRNRAKIGETAARYDREKALADIGRAIGFWSETDKWR
ncbi:MAG: TolC family protein [Desulfococcaceae bacterium]